MRYRLRTLLIVVALFCMPLARVAYLKNEAAFHHKQAWAHISKAARQKDLEPDDLYEVMLHQLYFRPHIVLESIRESAASDDAYWREYCSAMSHEMVARKFDRAVYRPWKLVSETPSP